MFLLLILVCVSAACIALVDEMNWKIGSVDKKSTVQVGSFRIDSSGNQQLREVSTFSLYTVAVLIYLLVKVKYSFKYVKWSFLNNGSFSVVCLWCLWFCSFCSGCAQCWQNYCSVSQFDSVCHLFSRNLLQGC